MFSFILRIDTIASWDYSYFYPISLANFLREDRISVSYSLTNLLKSSLRIAGFLVRRLKFDSK